VSEIRSQATPARDELERSAIGWQQYISRALGCKPGQLTYQLEECIEKIEGLKPRTVETLEEALTLPQGTVIQSSPTVCPRAGEIIIGISDQRHYVFWAGNECEDELATWMLPFAVLFAPGDAG